MFGRVTVAWIWLKQAVLASAALDKESLGEADRNFYSGKLQTALYYARWELPQIGPQAELLLRCDATTLGMQDAWF